MDQVFDVRYPVVGRVRFATDRDSITISEAYSYFLFERLFADSEWEHLPAVIRMWQELRGPFGIDAGPTLCPVHDGLLDGISQVLANHAELDLSIVRGVDGAPPTAFRVVVESLLGFLRAAVQDERPVYLSTLP